MSKEKNTTTPCQTDGSGAAYINNPMTVDEIINNANIQMVDIIYYLSVKGCKSALIKARCLVSELQDIMLCAVLLENGEVFSYNNDQFKLTSYAVKKGDKLEWKRNGSRGHVNAIVIGFSDKKPDYVFVENWKPDWSAPYESSPSKVWIKKRSVLRVKT